MTKKQLLQSADSSELAEWIAYERITGTLGSERFDSLAASICQITAEIHRDRKKRPRPFELDDFRLWNKAERKRSSRWIESPEQQIAFLRGMAELSKKVKRNRGK